MVSSPSNALANSPPAVKILTMTIVVGVAGGVGLTCGWLLQEFVF